MDDSGHSDGITVGDLLYQLTFTQDGDRTIATNADDYAVYDELSLSATVTHTFDPGTETWADDFDHTDYPTRYYALINATEEANPPEIVDRDPDEPDAADSNSFSLSTGVPDDGDMRTAADWGFTSTPNGVKLYAANVGMGNDSGGDQIAEGNFDVGSNGYAKYYDYIYAAQDCTLSGTTADEDESYTMNDVELSAGWNAIVTQTADGDIFDYYGGTIAEAQWTLME